MARVMGKAGRYVTQRLSRKIRSVLCTIFIGAIAVGALLGYTLARMTWPLIAILLIVEFALFVLGTRYLDRAEKDRVAWNRGLDGEVVVGRSLANDLPDTFRVIHDVRAQFGNVDHVVVGPTGVFAVETKNWRGLVTPDGKGELRLNGRPLDKPYVKRLTRSIMDLRTRWVSLAGSDRFIRGVIIFPSAWEDAPWGTTGDVHCIRVDKVTKYFTDPPGKGRLSSKEIDQLARAFLALARMDEGFEEKEDETSQRGVPGAIA